MDLAYDRAPYLFSGAAALKSFKAKTEGVVPITDLVEALEERVVGR